MAVVVLDIPEFRAMFFGQFIDPPYTDDVISVYFDWACVFINNSESGLISVCGGMRKRIIYLMMAHLLTLNAPGKDGSTVGRVSSASQGSVSVALDFPTTANNAWWVQTQYGAMVWELTRRYRSFRWIC